MRLLFDENLSTKLVVRLAELFPSCAHIEQFHLSGRPDDEIWALAARSDFIVVTADADFYERALSKGPPPKVIWLRRWHYTTREAETVLRREAIRIAHFAANADLGLLVLDRD